MLPLYLESLTTWQATRRWQWRNKLEYKLSLDSDLENETELSSELSSDLSPGEVMVGVEFNRW